MIRAKDAQFNSKSDTIKVDSSKQSSSPREFFQRIYGNLEKSKITSARQNEDVLDGSSSSSDANNFNFDATDFPDIQSFVLPYYNLQFNSQNVQFSMKPLHSSMHVVPFALGLSTFSPKRKRREGKIRRQRTTFNNEQTLLLENEFRINEYIPRHRRYELAEYLHLSETQIKIWFQNRRAKDKRIEKAQLDQQYRCSLFSRGWTAPFLYHHFKI